MLVLFPLNRYQAFGVHFFCSLILMAISAIWIFIILYPGLIAYASGVAEIFILMVFVDVVLGPLITLIIFDPQKKELKRDLLAIVLAQLIALFYGLWVMFSARPVFIVFNINQFDVVYANELSGEALKRAKNQNYSTLPLWGPVYVGARLPGDPEIAKRIITDAISGGTDLQYMPEYYVTYQNISADIISSAKQLADLHAVNKKNSEKVNALLDRYLSRSDKIGYVPLKAKVNNLTVIIDKETADIVELNKLQPLDYSFGVDSVRLKKSSERK